MRLAFKFVNCKMKYFLSILICSLLCLNISAQSIHQHPIDLDNCRDGENVEFRWASSENTDSYDISIKNFKFIKFKTKHIF